MIKEDYDYWINKKDLFKPEEYEEWIKKMKGTHLSQKANLDFQMEVREAKLDRHQELIINILQASYKEFKRLDMIKDEWDLKGGMQGQLIVLNFNIEECERIELDDVLDLNSFYKTKNELYEKTGVLFQGSFSLQSEKLVKGAYEKQGYTVIRGDLTDGSQEKYAEAIGFFLEKGVTFEPGIPDYIIFKQTEDGSIGEWFVVEVKTTVCPSLSMNQIEWRLKHPDMPYKLVIVSSPQGLKSVSEGNPSWKNYWKNKE